MAQTVKCLPAMQETRVRSLGWEDSPGEGNGNPFQYLPGKFHGLRSLVGYSPWDRRELYTICSSASFILLLIDSNVFFISVIVFINSLVVLYIFSLLKTSCNFSICASILFLSSWIIFMIITWNCFSGRFFYFHSNS